MPAYDSVELPGAPDIARAGNYAQLLMQGLENLPKQYWSGQEQRYNQRNRDLFSGGVPTVNGDPNGPVDWMAAQRKALESGGASQLDKFAQLGLGLEAQNRFYRELGGLTGGGGANTGPASSRAAASPANLMPEAFGGGRPRLSSTGMDSAGAETLRSLAVGIAGGRDVDVQGAVANAARMLRIDPDTPLSAGQEARARRLLGVSQPGLEGDDNNTNQGTPVGATGGAPISPAPTAASGSIAGAPRRPLQLSVGPANQPPAASFDQRFGAAYGGGQGFDRSSAGAPVSTPLGTARDAEELDRRAQRAYALSSAPMISPGQAEAARKMGDQLTAQARQIRETLSTYNAPTPEEKNVSSGATQRAGQIAADTKYYDSLHRGLAGSAMIAAQQKQNIDMLRQLASSPSFTPGFGSDLWRTYQRALAQFGIRPEGAAPREIFDQLAARVLADQFSGMKSMAAETGEQGARIFRSMLDVEEKANITHEDSLAGIRAKLDLLDRTGDLMMRWADRADDYKIAHGRLDAGFDKELRAEIGKARVQISNGGVGGAPPPGYTRTHEGITYRFKGGDPNSRANWEALR